MDLKKSNCPACGAPLIIEENSKNVNCVFCGSSLTIEYSKGKINASLNIDDMNNIARSISANSSELAIKRLKEEIRELKMQKEGIQASYNQRKAQLNPGFATANKGCTKPLLTLSAITFILSMIGFWAGAWKSTNVGLLITTIVLLAIHFGYNAYVDMSVENKNSEIRQQISDGEARLDEEQKKELKPIETMITRKEGELKQHLEVVSKIPG